MNKSFIDCSCTLECPYSSFCCRVPTEVITHEGRTGIDILIIGQGAGKDEERLRRCFVGRSGKYMRAIIKHIWDRGEIFNLAISNNVRFHPMDEDGKDREPTKEEMNRCFIHLKNDINTLLPKSIITVGRNATSTFMEIGTTPMGKLRGRPFIKSLAFPDNFVHQYTIIPTWHPSYLCRSYGSFVPDSNNLYDKQFIQDILTALEDDHE